MKARVNFSGSLSELISIDNGVRQGNILAPVLYSIYFAVLLAHAFENCDRGVCIRFQTSSELFSTQRVNTKSKTFQNLVHEFLYADDADLVAPSPDEM